MTLGELFESGIVIEGYRKIQCWEREDAPTIYHEGFDAGDIELYYDREVLYIFPYSSGTRDANICIEIREE